MRVLRFHASAHSRRDLPEVRDCQSLSHCLPTAVTQSFLFPLPKYFTFSHSVDSLSPLLFTVSPCLTSPCCSTSPEDFITLSLLVSFMSFTCQQRRECASSSPTKEKHRPVISENAAGRRGVGGRSTRKTEEARKRGEWN